MELWKSIVEYPDYEISSLGNCRNKNHKLLKPNLGKKGYYSFNLYKDKKPKTLYLHRLLAEAFLENPNNLECVDHINRNRLDNRLENLRWIDKKGNGMNRERGNTGEIYIYTSYRVAVPGKPQRYFTTLEEAIEARDLFLA